MAVRVDPEQYEFDTLLAFAGDLTGKRVLEIGSGSGRITTHLAPFAAHVTAIDPNKERIDQAIEQMSPDLADKISYQAIPLADVPPGERFDLALLSWSL